MKAPELPLPRKTVNQKKYSIPGETAEINAIIKELKDIGVVILITSPIQYTYLACPEDRWNLEIDSGLSLSLTRW